MRAWRYRSPSVPYRAGTSAKVLRRSHADVIVITICAVTLSRAPNFKVAAIWTLRYRTHYIAARPHSRRAAASRLPLFRVQTSVWSASPRLPESLHHLYTILSKLVNSFHILPEIDTDETRVVAILNPPSYLSFFSLLAFKNQTENCLKSHRFWVIFDFCLSTSLPIPILFLSRHRNLNHQLSPYFFCESLLVLLLSFKNMTQNFTGEVK